MLRIIFIIGLVFNKFMAIEIFKIQKLKQKPKGFTLIELLIATGVFVSVMVSLSQVYIAIVRSEQVAYALLNTENNIRNNLELIARSIRMGKDFEVLEGGQGICFQYYLEETWSKFCYEYGEDNNKKFNIKQKKNNQDIGWLFDSPDVEITKAKFYLINNGSDYQESIIIPLEIQTKVKTGGGEEQIYTFNIQTAVTPRFLQVE